MTERFIPTPRPCEQVQNPVTPPGSLQEQFFSLMRDPRSVRADILTSKHVGDWNEATSTVKSEDGSTVLRASLTRDWSQNGDFQLSAIENLKTGQKDIFDSTSAKAQFKLGDLSPQPHQMPDSERDLLQLAKNRQPGKIVGLLGDYTQESVSPNNFLRLKDGAAYSNRSETNFIVKAADGAVTASARLNLNGELTSEQGHVEDKNRNITAAFEYKFSPDGTVSACARSSKPDAVNADQLVWSKKIKSSE